MGKYRHYVLSVVVWFLHACSGNPDPAQQIMLIRELGELATTEYTITKIVKASDDKTWYKIGDRKILMSVEAVIKAGIDLSLVEPDDMVIRGRSVSLTVPPPRLISLEIPPDKIRIEYEEVGILRSEFTNAERDALLAQAESLINRDIAATGIFETTEKNTRQVLTRLLHQMGYEEIDIQFAHSTLKRDGK